jgi:hypothetical protein
MLMDIALHAERQTSYGGSRMLKAIIAQLWPGHNYKSMTQMPKPVVEVVV